MPRRDYKNMYTFEEHLNDINNWLQEKKHYNSDTLSWSLTVAYERWKNKDRLFSEEVNEELPC